MKKIFTRSLSVFLWRESSEATEKLIKNSEETDVDSKVSGSVTIIF
jgi:hypothetical protein